jgi:uncharacterized DUF497 family protein
MKPASGILTNPSFCSYTSVVVTWDERKREANLRRHGLDFLGCDAVFDAPVVTAEDSRRAYGEQRINLLGWLRDRVVHMTYTDLLLPRIVAPRAEGV